MSVLQPVFNNSNANGFGTMDLSSREKSLILIALLILLPLLFVRFILVPLNEYSDRQRSAVNRMEAKIRQVDLLGQRLKYLERNNNRQSGALKRRIDRILHQYRLRSRSRTIVDSNANGRQRLVLKLEEVNLTELIKVIYAIEHSLPVIVIKTIDINPAYKNKRLFRVSAALSSR